MITPNKTEDVVSQGALRMRECRARKKAGISDRYTFVCGVCGATRSGKYPHQKFCRGCRKSANTIYARERLGAEAIGTMRDCQNCGAQFCKTAKRQFYCVDCKKLSDTDSLPRHQDRRRKYAREYQRQLRRRDPVVAISNRMSANIKNSLRDGKNGRRWETLVGFTVADLMAHLEAKFLPDMTWDNRGEWHIDHIRPLCSFDFQTPDCPQFREAWALSNLQPLWAADNLRKGGRWAA